MTTTEMTEFLNRLRHDCDLAARLSAAVGGKDGEDALEALLAFATANGFNVTPRDVEAVRERFSSAVGEDGELTDADLHAMTGGASPELSFSRALHIVFAGITPDRGVTQDAALFRI